MATSTLRARPPVHIGQVVQNAVAFNLRNWSGPASASGAMDSLLEAVAELFALLRTRLERIRTPTEHRDD